MLLTSPTDPYRPMEAWLYDRLIAPAVVEMQGRLEDLLEELPNAVELLDVGCGGGQQACVLAERRTSLNITGLDLSSKQVARAKKRGQSFGARIDFVQGSALELPFPEARFDVVMSVASIKHWPDQQRGLRECVRVLKPGGRLLVIEVDRGCTFDSANEFVSRWRIPRVMRPFGLAMFRTWVAGHSLDVLEARALLGDLALDSANVSRIPNSPALMMSGHRQG